MPTENDDLFESGCWKFEAFLKSLEIYNLDKEQKKKINKIRIDEKSTAKQPSRIQLLEKLGLFIPEARVKKPEELSSQLSRGDLDSQLMLPVIYS